MTLQEPPESLDMGILRAGNSIQPIWVPITSAPPAPGSGFTVNSVTAPEHFTAVFSSSVIEGPRPPHPVNTPVLLPAQLPLLDGGVLPGGYSKTNYGVMVSFVSPANPLAAIYEGKVELQLVDRAPYLIPVRAETASLKVTVLNGRPVPMVRNLSAGAKGATHTVELNVDYWSVSSDAVNYIISQAPLVPQVPVVLPAPVAGVIPRRPAVPHPQIERLPRSQSLTFELTPDDQDFVGPYSLGFQLVLQNGANEDLATTNFTVKVTIE